MQGLEQKVFGLVVVAASLAFAAVIWPLYGAILWGTIGAIVFAPLHRRLAGRLGHHPTLAALATLAVIMVIVILPLAIVAAALVQESANVYDLMKSGQLDFGGFFAQLSEALPNWLKSLLGRLGAGDPAALQRRFTAMLQEGTQVLIAQILGLGQQTFAFAVNLFVGFYLLFFLLRDGERLLDRLGRAVPLDAARQAALLNRFTAVVRATVKGDILVSMLQGALGELAFWLLGIHGALLWAALMALLSLLPAVGAALVWLPVAIYLLVTGAVWQGLALLAFGALVISLVDNFLRPALVRADTKMPDYVVLISTLGGLQMFGPNGFVVGPVIAAMFVAVWQIFAASRN